MYQFDSLLSTITNCPYTDTEAMQESVIEEDRIDAAMEAAFVAELDRVEAAEREKIKAAEAKKKEFWAAESLRLATICGMKKKREDSGWTHKKTKSGKVVWMLKASKIRRTKAEQARHDAIIRKTKSRTRQATITEMNMKKKPATKGVKDARARRLAHHWKYLEDTLKKEKKEKMVPPEEREKRKIAEKEEREANMAELARLVEKRDRLVRERDAAVKREERRLAIKKMKDAQMSRAINLRKALLPSVYPVVV